MTKTKQYKYLKSALNKLKKLIVIAKKKRFGYGDGDWHEQREKSIKTFSNEVIIRESGNIL